MLDSTIKSIIDTARNVLVGKVPNPVSQIDLITIAMIYKFMDDMDNSVIQRGGKASFFKNNYDDNITKEENDKLGNVNLEPYAWRKLLSPSLGNEGRISLYSEALEKLQTSKQIPELFRQIFKGAFLPFRDGATLTMFLKEINKLSYDNSENLGNGFEYLLSIMGSQGDAGQFRTPRHIIDFIVDVVNPSKDDTILDPACGTAGFLISAYKHILKHNSKAFDAEKEIKSYSSEEIEIEHNLNGDKLTPTDRLKLTQNIKGYDISPDMQKLALVNLYLHGFKSPDIAEYDTLTNETKWNDNFDIILANPPFMTPKGGIQPHKKFSIQANRSEVLFVDYIAEHLNLKGKAGVIVPEGVIFQSQTAYKKLRKKLIEENYLYAVVSLPSGIFQPYSGVKTSILLIDREIAKKSDSILFIDIKNDGFDLGAQRKPIDKNDLTGAFYAIKKFQDYSNSPNETVKKLLSKYEMVNLVTKSEISKNEDYNLSGAKYIKAVDYSTCKWEMVNLGDVCTFTRGPFGGSLKKEIFQKTGYLVYEQYHAIKNDFSFERYYIDGKKYKEMERFKVAAGELIISCSGTMGKIAIIPDNFKEGIINQALLKLSPQIGLLDNKYLKYILEDDTYQERYFRSELGSAIKNVASVKDLKTIKIPLPPIDIQKEIVQEIESEEKAIEKCKKLIAAHEQKISGKIKSIWGEGCE